MDAYNTGHSYNGILFTLKKEGKEQAWCHTPVIPEIREA
jgi:hypothetical protein